MIGKTNDPSCGLATLALLRDFLAQERKYRDLLFALQGDAPALFKHAQRLLGMSQTEFASSLLVNVSTLGHVQHGRKDASPGLLSSLAELLADSGKLP